MVFDPAMMNRDARPIVGLIPRPSVAKLDAHESRVRIVLEAVSDLSLADDVGYVIEDKPLETPVAAVLIFFGSVPSVKFTVLEKVTQQFLRIPVKSDEQDWFRACLTLAEKQWAPLLEDRQRAAARIDYWHEHGFDFLPEDLDEYARMILSRWPVWKQKQMTWKECADDLAGRMRAPIVGEARDSERVVERLSKRCSRMGLRYNW